MRAGERARRGRANARRSHECGRSIILRAGVLAGRGRRLADQPDSTARETLPRLSPHRSNSVESNMTHADAIAMEERGAVHHERTSSGGALDSSVTHSGNPIVGFQPVAPVGSSRARGGSGHDCGEPGGERPRRATRVTDGGGSSGGALETIDQSPQTAGSGDGFDEAWRAEARREAEMFIGSDSSSSEPIAINGGGGGMSRTKSIGSRLASTSLVERTGDWRSYNPWWARSEHAMSNVS